eukprot:6314521-Prymnesium_polylepis.2
MAKLEKRFLYDNLIGDEGTKSFSTALVSGAMAQLKILYLADNQIGDKGMNSFSTALVSGALAQLNVLFIGSSSCQLREICNIRSIGIH